MPLVLHEQPTAAVTVLQTALETNEPINRREGNFEQADLESKSAAEIRAAIHILAAIHVAKNGIWPTPTS